MLRSAKQFETMFALCLSQNNSIGTACLTPGDCLPFPLPGVWRACYRLATRSSTFMCPQHLPPLRPEDDPAVTADTRALISVLGSRAEGTDRSALIAAVASSLGVLLTALTFWFGPDSLSREQTNKEIAYCTKGVAVVGALSLPVDTATWERRKAGFWEFYTGERFLLSEVNIEPALQRVESAIRVEHTDSLRFVRSQPETLSMEVRKQRAYAALNKMAEQHAREIARNCNSLYP